MRALSSNSVGADDVFLAGKGLGVRDAVWSGPDLGENEIIGERKVEPSKSRKVVFDEAT